MTSTLHLPNNFPRPRSAASSVKSVRSSKSVRSTSPTSSVGNNRDENDALRPYVDAISQMFVRTREKGYNFSAVSDCIEEEMTLKKIEPIQIFSWLSSNQNTVQYTTLLGFFYFQGIGIPVEQRKGFSLFLTAAKMDFFVAQDLAEECGNSDAEAPLAELLAKTENSGSQSPMPQISRDENDAIRRVVDELIENFVDMKERGNQDETISRFINDFIIDNKRFPSQIYDWLLNNQNTAQYITLLGYFYFDAIGTEEDIRKSFTYYSLDKLQRRVNKSASQPPSEPSTSSPQSDSQEETDSVSSQKGEEDQNVEAVQLIITNEEQFDESTSNENEK
ncbi:15401_t:CDS:2 [Dentiscutata erythropus]|uniref:15401_t:CDS:1 n=1 Tax=Dentiscutata erythropus TaxID=1348616 RepID=A0A9N9B3A4_9GLOM|nr:15401_t:CDS:2 [Dentiscutata erythropus]